MTTLYSDLTDPVLELCEKNLKILRDALAGDLGGKVKLYKALSDVPPSQMWLPATSGNDGDESTPYTNGSMCDILGAVQKVQEKVASSNETLSDELKTILDAFKLLGFEPNPAVII